MACLSLSEIKFPRTQINKIAIPGILYVILFFDFIIVLFDIFKFWTSLIIGVPELLLSGLPHHSHKEELS
jgi:hypothetical protein